MITIGTEVVQVVCTIAGGPARVVCTLAAKTTRLRYLEPWWSEETPVQSSAQALVEFVRRA
jgi:hypothetical protein